ncbi:helix-turn-helix domain-containing protein [Actinoplanes sp. Pm04-4]|uniref:Helix-turn-helix domain-containing protein n=1 Tax=Paractinoplanes pyxinae TaxID=2997416 RepID=A0ABT4B6X9_9ACTN|nr:helix-turn-helix domain-containing protein [Actinoplanes pyxinae]MCY1141610.1 helix-turn-helix domain-containing protein [Actinoplanes pyxinae]
MAARESHLPIERVTVRSGDLDWVQEMIDKRYTDHVPRVRGDARRFGFRSQFAGAGALSIDRVSYQACMAITADPHDSMLIISMRGGGFDVSTGRQRCRVGGGEALLLPRTGLDMVQDWPTYEVAQFPAEAVTRAAARAGVAPADFRFDAMTAVSPAANQRWLATHTYLTQLLTNDGGTGIPELLLTAAIDAAVTAALSVFPNTTMTVDYIAGPGRVPPATVRRAVAYIDAHADQPITGADIAASAAVSVRALQAGFRRHLNTTPLACLRRVRLERAHRDLQTADPTTGATVAAIARRWGFADLSRFAADYRRTFNRLPRDTLHR